MSRPPSPTARDAAAGPAQTGAEEPCHLEARFCPPELEFARGDLQQDIIDMLKPVDDERIKEGMPDTEFNRKYPPDAWCEEAAPNARVWKICRDEATASDRDMLESWNKTLDVLLIFAGLFSAVSTAFLVESYKTLQPDYSQYVAAFLYSAAVAYHRSGTPIPPLNAIQAPEDSLQKITVERWINGLWFISLAISLLVALLSILVKQWLDEYRARVSRSATDHESWARRHALYHDGLRSWGVPVIISCLPLLLHVSLFLFLAGLVIFLRLLDEVIALGLLALIALFFGVYLLSVILPAFYIACPSTTPVLTHFLHAWSVWVTSLGSLVSRLSASSKYTRIAASIAVWTRSVGNRETRTILAAQDELNAAAIAELVDRTDDPDVMTVIAEAMGEFPGDSLDMLMHEHTEAFDRIRYHINIGTHVRTYLNTSAFASTSFARCQRAQLALLNCSPQPSYSQGVHLVGSPDLRVALGIEGALLCTLCEWEPAFSENCGIRNLVAALRSIDWIPASQVPGAPDDSLPHRSCLHLPFCLLFLETAARIAELSRHEGGKRPLSYSPHFYSLVMLVFCAAQFASEFDSYEAEVASDYLVSVVDTGAVVSQSSEFTKSDSAAPRDCAAILSSSIGALCTMLAHLDKYNIHPDVASLVSPYVLALAVHECADLSCFQGISDVILSDNLEKYTTSVEEVTLYARAVSKASRGDAAAGAQHTQQLLRCYSVLARRALSLNSSPLQYYYLFLTILYGINTHLHRFPRPQKDAVLLAHILADTTVLEDWMEASWHYGDNRDSPVLALDMRMVFAGTLAATLCRRLRMNADINADWMHALFTNPLVVQLARSVLVAATSINSSTSSWHFGESFDFARRFFRHWKQASPESWAGLCDHLHSTCGDSGLGPEMIEQFRNGVAPGDIGPFGALDCDKDCDCMRPYAPDSDHPLTLPGATLPPARGNSRAGWKHRVRRWRPWAKRGQSDGEMGQEKSAAAAEV